MSTGIRFPVDLPPPSREGYGDEFEETRSKFAPEVGAARRRQRTRATPRLFSVQWAFDQDQYQTFDKWWQYVIQGGALPFDIQLLDDDATLTWFTVYFMGDYDAEVVGVMDWRVRGTLRAIDVTFGTTRAPGTDELLGRAAVGVTAATGKLLITRALRGAANVGLQNAEGHLLLPPLEGEATVGLYSATRGKLGPFPFRGEITVGISDATGLLVIGVVNYYPELSRQWQNLDWFGRVGGSEDINTEPAAVSREWMEV